MILNYISICWIPDLVKSHKWMMWEYRELHKSLFKRKGFLYAWEFTSLTVGTYKRRMALHDNA